MELKFILVQNIVKSMDSFFILFSIHFPYFSIHSLKTSCRHGFFCSRYIDNCISHEVWDISLCVQEIMGAKKVTWVFWASNSDDLSWKYSDD